MTWFEEEGTVFKYSDERRHDPVLKEKVTKVLNAQEQAYKEASELVRQASEIMRKAAGFDDSAIYERSYNAVRGLEYTLDRDASFIGGQNEGYIRNTAAGRMGLQIEQMGDRFPF